MNNEALLASYARSLRLLKRSPQTSASYASKLRVLRAWSGDLPLLELTRADLETFVEHRMSTVSDVTAANDVVMLGRFYRWCESEELISRSPLARMTKPPVEPTEPRVLTAEEITRLLKTCAGRSFTDRRDHALIRLLSQVGSPRIGELRNMTVASVDLDSGLITVTGKTKERVFPATDKTSRALELYLRERDRHPFAGEQAFWIGHKGGLTHRGFAGLIHRRAAAAKLGRVTPHVFRHTVTSMAQEAGMADGTLEALMGWAPGSGMVNKVYGRATRVRRAQEAARRLGDLV